MGLPQWAHTNKGRGGEGNAPLAHLHPKASSAHPQLPPCPLTPASPAPWGPRPSQMGHPRALLSACEVWSRLPSPALAPSSPATPGLWPADTGKSARTPLRKILLQDDSRLAPGHKASGFTHGNLGCGTARNVNLAAWRLWVPTSLLCASVSPSTLKEEINPWASVCPLGTHSFCLEN